MIAITDLALTVRRVGYLLLLIVLLLSPSCAAQDKNLLGGANLAAATELATLPIHTPQVSTPSPVPSPSPEPSPTITATSTLEPTATDTPEPTPTSTPEMVLEEGEVRYEFIDPATDETIALAVPKEWVDVINKAEQEPGQKYKEVPLAYARIEGEEGNRKLIVGNIDVAAESPNGWIKSDDVYTITDYLGFEGLALAQDEYLGSHDAQDVPIEKPTTRIGPPGGCCGSWFVENLGTRQMDLIQHVMPIEASRTNIVVPFDEGLLETATMLVTFAYRDDARELFTFTIRGHYLTYADDRPVMLSNWTPPLGKMLQGVALLWAAPGGLLSVAERRDYADSNHFEWRMMGLTEVEGSSGVTSLVRAGETIDLPIALFESVE